MITLTGVNFGGWLIAEHLTTPALFEGVNGRDEFSIISELGERGRERLRAHRRDYLKEEDFAWLVSRGINAVRVPVPHWVFGDFEPFAGCLQELDWAMDMARKHELRVLLDLHTAPGSQNGNDHSGRAGTANWHTGAGNIARTVDVLEKLALRYGAYENLWGLEVLNEPSSKVPLDLLQDFYSQAYRRIRAICDTGVKIVMHDAFQPEAWEKFFRAGNFENVVLDMHLYHVFDREDKRLDIHKQLKKVLNRRDILAEVQNYVPVVVGEWSLGLQPRAFRGLDAYEADKARQAFGRLQLNTYQKTEGWFFWTYKTDDLGGWNFRFCVEKGWLPSTFQEDTSIEILA